jgi:hypothetical protein
MTILMEQVYEEALRYVYVLSSSRWLAALAPVALGAVAAGVVLAATRLRTPSPRTPHPATKVEAEV